MISPQQLATLSPRLVGQAELSSLEVSSLSQHGHPGWLGEPLTDLSVMGSHDSYHGNNQTMHG